MIVMNKIIKKDTILYIDRGDQEVNIDINGNCIVDIYQFVIDDDSNISVNLNCEGASVNYYYSNINYYNHVVSVNIKHNKKNTVSNIYNHGVNVLDNKLDFLVNGIILKDMNGAVCNQENQIINISNGKSTICPNLLIDCFDVESSHSAYIGKFSKDKLFYLESRGLNKNNAYHLLMKGFLIPNGVLEDRVKDYLDEIEKI